MSRTRPDLISVVPNPKDYVVSLHFRRMGDMLNWLRWLKSFDRVVTNGHAVAEVADELPAPP